MPNNTIDCYVLSLLKSLHKTLHEIALYSGAEKYTRWAGIIAGIISEIEP